MKQMITLFLLAGTMLAKGTPTKTDNDAALKSFEAAYGKNTPANWSATAEGHQVEFEMKGQYITAVYNKNGGLRWYKKHLLSTQLPVNLQLKLKNRLAGYWIADVQEQSGKAGTAYTLTLENGQRKVVLQSVGGAWQQVKTQIK